MLIKFNEFLESVVIKFEDFKEVPENIEEILIGEDEIELRRKDKRNYGVIKKYNDESSTYIITYYKNGNYVGKTFSNNMFEGKYKLVNILLTLK